MRFSWMSRLGGWWYAIPSLLVVGLGLATCHLIEERADFDTFEIESVLPQGGGQRSAVLVRQHHADSSATVRCIWIVSGPPPSPGPTRRLTESCALVAADRNAVLEIQWLRSGKLGVRVHAGTSPIGGEKIDGSCYFETKEKPRQVCYRTPLVEIVALH